MKKLSALIFSRDEPEKTMDLAKDMLDVADQIVIIDSSPKQKFNRLQKLAKSKKIYLHHTLALGYPDPIRVYGLAKCRHDWVLYIDTDERISSELKKDIKTIISKTKYDAFAVKRYENSSINGKKDGYFTWQTRLYNKRKIIYRGLLHEQPLVSGRFGKLDDDRYFMLHVDELKTAGSKRRDLEYSLIKKYYDRLSYSLLNERMKEYLTKFFLPDKKIEHTLIGKIVLGWMKFYQTVTLRKMHSELSTFDYFIFFSMIEGAYVIKRKDLGYLLREGLPTVINDSRNTARFKKDKNSREIFEISKKVNKKGITKYLMLDNDRIMERLYQKYKNKRQGISLLMKLLEDRYEGYYP